MKAKFSKIKINIILMLFQRLQIYFTFIVGFLQCYYILNAIVIQEQNSLRNCIDPFQN
jgi:hypothetical protein